MQNVLKQLFDLKKVEERWKRKILFHFRKYLYIKGIQAFWWKWKRIAQKKYRIKCAKEVDTSVTQ